MLHVVPSLYRDTLADLVDESILTAMSGAASPEVVLASLILSYAPEPPTIRTRPAPTPLRMISKAYTTGLGIGLPERVEAGLRQRDPVE